MCTFGPSLIPRLENGEEEQGIHHFCYATLLYIDAHTLLWCLGNNVHTNQIARASP